MKNLNSFKSVQRAIEYEAKRQAEVLVSGGIILQETRKWDDDKGKSSSMRSKEHAQDYRYFPDPDLLPISVSYEEIEKINFSPATYLVKLLCECRKTTNDEAQITGALARKESVGAHFRDDIL